VQTTTMTDAMRPPVPAEPGAGVYSNKLGMWVFLASDVMFFTALIGSYIVLRFGMGSAWARPGAVLNVPLTGLNTFLLICSSVSMVKAYAAIADGKKYFLRKVPGKTLQDGGLKFWLLVTIICGAGFVGVQWSSTSSSWGTASPRPATVRGRCSPSTRWRIR